MLHLQNQKEFSTLATNAKSIREGSHHRPPANEEKKESFKAPMGISEIPKRTRPTLGRSQPKSTNLHPPAREKEGARLNRKRILRGGNSALERAGFRIKTTPTPS